MERRETQRCKRGKFVQNRAVACWRRAWSGGGGPAVKWEMGDCRFLIGLIVGLTHNSLDNQRHDAVSFDEFHSIPTIHPTLTWSIITTHFGFLLVEAGDVSVVDIRSLGSRSLLVATIMVSPLLVVQPRWEKLTTFLLTNMPATNQQDLATFTRNNQERRTDAAKPRALLFLLLHPASCSLFPP